MKKSRLFPENGSLNYLYRQCSLKECTLKKPFVCSTVNKKNKQNKQNKVFISAKNVHCAILYCCITFQTIVLKLSDRIQMSGLCFKQFHEILHSICKLVYWYSFFKIKLVNYSRIKLTLRCHKMDIICRCIWRFIRMD